MARRAGYIKAFKERYKQTPLLLVDSGYFLADDRSTHGRLRFDAAAKNEWVLKANDHYAVAAANLSSHDFLHFSEMKAGAARNASFDKYVSANVASASADSFSPKKYVIREVATQQAGASGKLRVAFIGLTEQAQPQPAGFTVTDPVAAARRVVPEAKRLSDIVIVLAVAKTPEATRIAREAPGIDIIIAGNGDMFTPPMMVADTLVVFTPYESRMLGELRIYREAQGRFTTRQRYISLDEMVGDDPEALKMAAAASDAEKNSYKTNQDLLAAWLAEMARKEKAIGSEPVAAAGPKAAYVSSSACAQCHTSQYMKWANGQHARASDALIRKKGEFQAGCFNCHTTGLEPAKAMGEDHKPELANVQCEQCHGPASNHVIKPARGYGRIADMKALCSSCHTAETSPQFNLQTYWEKIKH